MMMRRLGLAVVLAGFGCSDDGVPAADTDGDGGSSGGTAVSTTLPGGEGPGGDGLGSEGETAASSVDTGDASATADSAADSSSGGAPPPTGTAGCGMPGSPGVTTVSIDVDGTEREYLVVIPDGYDPATPLPLVFAWHGRGSTHEQARLYFGLEAAAAGGALFIYPQGLPVESMGGQSGWDLAPEGIDVAFFDAMLAAAQASLCIDPARVFSSGHSFGGYITNALGCFRAADLRAIGSVAGGPAFGDCEPDERVAALLVHGSLDAIVPIEQGMLARDQLVMRNECADTSMPVDPEPCVARDGCLPGYDVWWCEHDIPDFDGHTWPSFAPDAIWGFFASQSPEG
jgi:polyhydroxybutyrate depolymerase